MPLPGNVSIRAVSATYTYADGSPASGWVSFTPSVPTAGGGTIIPLKALQVTLDANGNMACTLATTDDSDLSPTGWTYTVKETIAGAPQRTYVIQVPSGAGALDLSAVAPVIDPPDVDTYVRSSGGVISGDLTVDGTLKLRNAGTVELGVALDTNFYRVGPGYLGTDSKFATGQDFQCWDSNRGLLLTDRVTGTTYRLKISNGTLGLEVAP